MKNQLWFALVFVSGAAYSQGCTPIRSLTGFGQYMLPGVNLDSVNWFVNISGRYFNSAKTFDGTNGNADTLGVNNVYSTNFSFTRLLKKGWSVTVDIPFMAADRTSWREHDTGDPARTQYTTRSFGLGDIRLSVYRWLLDTSIPHKGNIQIGLGVKLPTGDYRYQDYFHKDHTTPLITVVAPVNQSIQTGDGGTGITLELNSYYSINQKLNLYGNFFYLSNPRDQNGTSSTFGGIASPTLIKTGGQVNTVPDAYTMRTGANFTFKKFVFWLGARKEGVPVHDLIGASNGTRRPGTAISIEPGLNYKFKKSIIYMFVPIPFYREALQSVPNKIQTQLTGVYAGSPAAFANYLIFVGVLYKL